MAITILKSKYKWNDRMEIIEARKQRYDDYLEYATGRMPSYPGGEIFTVISRIHPQFSDGAVR
jgi:hypothetical protein